MNENLIVSVVRPSRADAMKNRELLLETAQRLFTEQGVEAVTMSAVAEAAGVGKGTLYRHFSNKSQLCEVLIDADARALQERTLALLRAGGTPHESLRIFLNDVLDFVERHEAFLALEEVNSVVLLHPAHLWWRQTLRGLLAAASIRMDVDYAADVLYLMLDARTIRFQKARGASLEWVRRGLLDTAERLLD